MSILQTLENREYNPKCIAISAGVVAAYWFLPPKQALIAAGLAVGTYIGIAHYDSLYNCEERLYSFDGWFSQTFGVFKPHVGTDGTYGGDLEPVGAAHFEVS